MSHDLPSSAALPWRYWELNGMANQAVSWSFQPTFSTFLLDKKLEKFVADIIVSNSWMYCTPICVELIYSHSSCQWHHCKRRVLGLAANASWLIHSLPVAVVGLQLDRNWLTEVRPIVPKSEPRVGVIKTWLRRRAGGRAVPGGHVRLTHALSTDGSTVVSCVGDWPLQELNNHLKALH